MDSLNSGEDVSLVHSDCASSLPGYSVESAVSLSSSSQPSHALLEVTLARRIMQVVATAQPDRALVEVAEVLSEMLGAEGCEIGRVHV